VIIGDVAGIAGNAMWISFILAALIAMVTGFSYAELSSIFPKSAAEYVYSKNAFDSNLVGSIAGCMIIFVSIVSAATVAIGFAEYFAALFFSQFNPILFAIILIILLSFINFYGISESIRINTTFAFIELAGLVLIIIAGLWIGSPTGTDYFQIPGNVSLHQVPYDVAIVLLSITFTTVVAFAVTALVGWEDLSESPTPLALVAEEAFGRSGDLILSTIALFATSNTCLMMLISGSRIIYGMSKVERERLRFIRH
jgi:APA family basic amino acid/polyamine antiporter